MLKIGSLYQVYRLLDGSGQPVTTVDRHGNSGLNMQGRYGGYRLLDFVVPFYKHSDYINMYDIIHITNDGGVTTRTVDGRELQLTKKCVNVEETFKSLVTFSKKVNDIDDLLYLATKLRDYIEPCSRFEHNSESFTFYSENGETWQYDLIQRRVV